MSRVRVSISLTPSLRHQIEMAREESGRSLSDEIEAQLRSSLNHQGGELLLLKMDDGLMGWLRACVRGIGLWGDLQDTAIFFIRSQIVELNNQDVWFCAMAPHLPAPYRENVMGLARYKRLNKEVVP